MRFFIVASTILCFLLPSEASDTPRKLERCLQTMIRDIKSQNSSGYGLQDLRDDDGKRLLDISLAETAAGMSYSSCALACGDGSDDTHWADVGQQTGTWLLPSLAIIAQLPFGAYSTLDDWTAVVLTIGCPVLAAYSLALTVLNERWITRRFDGIDFGAASDAIRCLRNLQQTPIKLGPKALLASLVVLPCNDQYWHKLAHKMDKQNSTWTTPVIISLGWVVIAYLLTVATSSLRVESSIGCISIGAAWCFLLAIVTGWLMVSPKCNARRNAKCLRVANAIAHIAPSDHSEPLVLDGICLENDPSYSQHRAFELIEEPDSLLRDQMSSQPLYNYARYHTWTAICHQVHRYYRNSHFQRFHSHTVHGGRSDCRNNARNRSGTLSQVLKYCEEDKYTPANSLGGRNEDWLIACALALSLQWGTIGAATLALVLTPTKGLGCRSLAYLIYGGVATVAWMLFLLSSWLAHQVQLRIPANETAIPHTKGSLSSSSVGSLGSSMRVPSRKLVLCRFLSITFRRLAKFFSTINAIGFLAICFVHFTDKFDTCYCNSSVIGRGANHAYVLALWNDGTVAMKDMTKGFIGCLVLSLMCSAGFIVFLRSYVKPRRFSDPQSFA
ncbi:hypothetical protein DL96DRAFT_1502426 [Flagelloscypha sp. PMI_526]|nr:hypothetical protein DL96DRAFT_1502426 [Flagelloscypha sp. PMI_526]